MEVMIVRPAPMYIGGAFFGYLLWNIPIISGGKQKGTKHNCEGISINIE